MHFVKHKLLHTTIEKIKQLDENRLESVINFIESISAKSESESFTTGIAKLAEQSKTFDFLNNEPDIYTDADLIKSK